MRESFGFIIDVLGANCSVYDSAGGSVKFSFIVFVCYPISINTAQSPSVDIGCSDLPVFCSKKANIGDHLEVNGNKSFERVIYF